MTKIKLNLSEFRALRKAMDDEIMKRAQRVADASNADAKARGYDHPEYVAEESPSKNRARATVYPNNGETMHDMNENLTLLKNIWVAK